MTGEAASEIDRGAANWAARVDRGLSPAEAQEFGSWLEDDVRRLGAYARVRAISLQFDSAAALGSSYDPSHFVVASADPARSSRRAVLLAAAGLAGLAELLLAGTFEHDQNKTYETSKGELRQVALADGSVVTLNTATRVTVRFSRAARVIRLHEGEALFDVVKDTRRSFIVLAGTTRARALGTSFSVSRVAGRPVHVVVRTGTVEVSRGGSAGESRVRLGANVRAIDRGEPLTAVHPGPIGITAISEAEVHRELAWRDGEIAFEGETLSQAALEFARYSDTKIIVADPALGREEVAGLFQAHDPIGFARAIAQSLNAHARIVDGAVRLSR